MLKRFYILLFIALAFSSCKSAKITTRSKTPIRVTTTKPNTVSTKAQSIIDYAKQFKGVKYKYGGTTRKGMDCSGLILTTFKAHDITMPRTTKELSVTGNWIDIKDVEEGDLVFFATKKNSRKINHVGIVTSLDNNVISFIHASSSKGVIISSLKERYWYLAYVQARRYL